MPSLAASFQETIALPSALTPALSSLASVPAVMTPLDVTAAIVSAPLRLPPEALLREAISAMSHTRGHCPMATADDQGLAQVHLEARASCVLVMAGDRLLGIVTERDVVRLSLEFSNFGEQPLAAVMTPAVITLRQRDLEDMFFVLQVMRQHHIRHLPVLDDADKVVGVITHESLRQVIRPTDLLRARLVSEVMTAQVMTAQPGDWVRSVAATMASHRISCVMVVEPMATEGGGYRPVGILTERDLLQFYALGLAADQHPVAAVMSTPVFSVSPEESLWRVQQLMATHRITRLAVTGHQGELLGIVTQTSLLQGLNPLEIYKLAETLEARVHRLEAEKVALLEERNAELERQVTLRTQALQTQTNQERLLRSLATRIRASLSLPDILATTVHEVRQLLGCDRVTILQFDEHWHSTVVAESTNSATSLLGERIADCCFQAQQAERYRRGHIRVVPDIYTTEMSDCHREMLIRLKTRAKILVPLLCGDDLWGLLNVNESDQPRQWTEAEVSLLQSLGV
ncbi:MAG: CBS domain-containing protein, partial [Leptolyngbya sp.]|nr:CBS domain-containing protein [Leptolyngbya sp.]